MSSCLYACVVLKAGGQLLGKGCPPGSLLALCYNLVVSCRERVVHLPFRLCCVIAWWSAAGKGMSSCLSASVVLYPGGQILGNGCPLVF